MIAVFIYYSTITSILVIIDAFSHHCSCWFASAVNFVKLR